MKKILIALMALLLPTFIVYNLLADQNSSNEEEQITVDNDIMINSPLFTSKETNEVYTQPEVSMIMDGFEKVAENSKLQLFTNEDNGAIRIVNVKTGYVWASDLININEFGFNKVNTRKVQAAFEMTYRDESKKADSNNSSESDVKLTISSSNNVVTYKVNNTDAKIKFEYTIELTETGINLKLPHESIKENGDCVLTSITFFQYFGSVFGSSIPGYLFVPSGNGGLVRFDTNPAINSIYSQSYYGTDANRNKDKEESVLSLPVYGITHGVEQNAVFTRIKSGAEFATFNYSPSSISQVVNQVTNETNGFHMVYNTFNYRQTYTMTIPGADSILMIPEDFYKSDVEVSYTILSDEAADYVGMAQAYQADLKAEGVIDENSNSGTGNVHIDVLGGETESGIIFDKFVKMTTTSQLNKINDELTKKFDNKFVYTLRGFYKKGYSKQSYDNIKFNSKLGSLKDISDLNYYMYYNPVESYNSKLSYPTNVLVNVYNEKSYVTMETDAKYKFFTNVDSIISGYTKASKQYEDALAVDALGYRLYGDENADYERYEVLAEYETLIEGSLPMFKPNEYFLKNTSHYLNMPLYHDRVRFITDSVPFLQIVLRGYIDYYSTYLNFSTNQEIDLLKCIEYGSNLAYLVSYEESYKIANTLSSHLYATHYESNKNQIFSQINEYNLALSNTNGEQIVDRYIIEPGVVEVTYSNGIKVYVNYTDTSFTYGNVVIDAMDYKVVK